MHADIQQLNYYRLLCMAFHNLLPTFRKSSLRLRPHPTSPTPARVGSAVGQGTPSPSSVMSKVSKAWELSPPLYNSNSRGAPANCDLAASWGSEHQPQAGRRSAQLHWTCAAPGETGAEVTRELKIISVAM